MNWRRLTVLALAVVLVGVALLAGISYWSDSMAGESNSYYAADASALYVLEHLVRLTSS